MVLSELYREAQKPINCKKDTISSPEQRISAKVAAGSKIPTI